MTMNLIQIQDQLKGLPTQAIMAYADGQNPQVPPYVALAELSRRKQLEAGAAPMQGGQKPTVKEQIEQSTGLMGLQNAQQQQAMQSMAQAPQQGPVPQNAPQGPVQGEGFAGGGAVAFDEGGDVTSEDVYDPVTGALISSGGQWREPTVEEEWKKKYLKKPTPPAGVAKPPISGTEQAGLQAAIERQKRAPVANVPPPAQLRQQINQGAPATPAQPAPAASGIEAAFNKQAMDAMNAKPDLKTDMATAAAAMPRSKYEAEYEQSIRDQRAADLARRETPKNWYENEGLMATMRGFAQADPRRPWGAASAARSDFQQQQTKQRAAEDALFREGLGALNKSEQDRVKAQFEYAVGQGKDVNAAKKSAMNDVGQLLVAKGNNETNILGHKISAAATMGAARLNAATREGIADTGLLQKINAAIAKEQADIAKDPKYVSAARNPAVAAERAAKEAAVIRKYVAQYPELKGKLGDEGVVDAGINTAQWGQPSIVPKK